MKIILTLMAVFIFAGVAFGHIRSYFCPHTHSPATQLPILEPIDSTKIIWKYKIPCSDFDSLLAARLQEYVDSCKGKIDTVKKHCYVFYVNGFGDASGTWVEIDPPAPDDYLWKSPHREEVRRFYYNKEPTFTGFIEFMKKKGKRK